MIPNLGPINPENPENPEKEIQSLLPEYPKNVPLPRPFLENTVQQMTKDFSLLIDSGAPVLRALKVLAYMPEHLFLQPALEDVAKHIESGGLISEGFERHPRIFSKAYVNMVKAGEVGGVLEVILKRLAESPQLLGTERALGEADFAYILGIMTASGVPLLRVLSIAEEIFQAQPSFAKAIKAMHKSVEEGDTLMLPMSESKMFSPMLIALVDIGEQTGSLPELLLRYAEHKTAQ